MNPERLNDDGQVAGHAELGTASAAESHWITSSEAAAYLKVKVRTLLLWVRQGRVPAFALSGTKRRVWRFRKQDLDAVLLSRPVIVSGSPAVATERRGV